jgi:hypothetical protein
LDKAEPLHAARLQFLFAQDLYARSIFSKDGVVNVEAARMAMAWTLHQLETRATVWPLDHSPDKAERVYMTLQRAFVKKPEMTFREMKRLCHTDRAGSGGIATLNFVVRNMITAGELVESKSVVPGIKPGKFVWVG